MPCHSMYMHLQNFRKFFLLITHYLLSKAPYVCPFGLAWSIHGSYVQGLWLWTWLSVLALCCCCLSAFTCVALWIYPGSGSLALLVG